jgi:hypothetical protein
MTVNAQGAKQDILVINTIRSSLIDTTYDDNAVDEAWSLTELGSTIKSS